MAGKRLQATEVYRGGSTARQLIRETRKVEVEPSDDKNALQISFSMDSKGGGVTIVHVDIGPEDFSTMLDTMVSIDRQTAISAMANELAKQIAKQPEYDAKIADSTLDSVKSAAFMKYLRAPAENRETEDFTHKQVNKLIGEMKSGSKDKKKGPNGDRAA